MKIILDITRLVEDGVGKSQRHLWSDRLRSDPLYVWRIVWTQPDAGP